jgi:hypothetical protein
MRWSDPWDRVDESRSCSGGREGAALSERFKAVSERAILPAPKTLCPEDRLAAGIATVRTVLVHKSIQRSLQGGSVSGAAATQTDRC